MAVWPGCGPCFQEESHCLEHNEASFFAPLNKLQGVLQPSSARNHLFPANHNFCTQTKFLQPSHSSSSYTKHHTLIVQPVHQWTPLATSSLSYQQKTLLENFQWHQYRQERNRTLTRLLMKSGTAPETLARFALLHEVSQILPPRTLIA